VQVQMPNFGLSIVEGTIENWNKKEGDLVQKDEILVTVTTEKVAVDIPAECSGVLLKIFFTAGQTVKVGETIAMIGAPGEAAAGVVTPPQRPAAAESSASAAERRKERIALRTSPLAVKIAAEHGVDIREVAARYPEARIGKKEIFDFLEERKKEKPAPAVSAGESKPLTGALRAMAEHMAVSAKTAARVTTVAEVDMTELVTLRNGLKERCKQDYGISLTFVPFVMRAISEGMKRFPILNASLRGEEIVFHPAVNVGLAVDTGESLLVPVIRDVEHKGIVEISREVAALSTKARDGKLNLQDIQEGTFTLTNAGVYGALLATPIIHQPQSAILWMGKAMETPVVRDHQIVIRWIMYLCLSYDHRIIMGAQAVQFLQVVKKTLESPYALLLSGA
jgi:2-oxoglutarate dehydrogenase complex dihydrolipoamide succinyltransferase (E2) component